MIPYACALQLCFILVYVVAQNWLSWPFTLLVKGRSGSEPGLVAQFFSVLTFRNWHSLGFSNNRHCFSKQKINRTSSWCWSVLWVFWFISSVCSFSGNGFHREASFYPGEVRDVPHQCIDLFGWGAFHVSPVGLCGTLSWIYCVFCLWVNKYLFYYINCVLGKLA